MPETKERYSLMPIYLFVDNEFVSCDSIDVEFDTPPGMVTIIANDGGRETEIIANSEFVTRKLTNDGKGMIIAVDSSNKVP